MPAISIQHRAVQRVIAAVQTTEGGGVPIRRAFPTAQFADLDPFLLLDEMGPLEARPGQAPGFPPHPHRGFETVTYLLEGQIGHQDSLGHQGLLNPGSVQWMTAGSGLVHSEMPGPDFVREGGRLHGFQLWVNLPKRDKMTPPAYQELAASQIPVVRNPAGDVSVTLIAGEAWGQRGPIRTHSPLQYLHFTLEPGAELVHPVPQDLNAFAYVIKGQGEFGEEASPAGAGHLVLFSSSGEAVTVRNRAGRGPLDLLLIAGRPLNEPVARWGPFVMNTKDELRQAMEDYKSGRMGVIR